MLKLNLVWNRCQDGDWCPLMDLNLNHSHFDDMEWVYIIRHWWNNPKVVRVGQWIIKNRLAEHRTNTQITKYQNLGLFVTRARVAAEYRDWVEKYLADLYDPIVWERFPDRQSISVNSPWSES